MCRYVVTLSVHTREMSIYEGCQLKVPTYGRCILVGGSGVSFYSRCAQMGGACLQEVSPLMAIYGLLFGDC